MAKKLDTDYDIQEMVEDAFSADEGEIEEEVSEEKPKKKAKELDTDDGLPDGDFMEDYLYSEEVKFLNPLVSKAILTQLKK